MTFDGSAKVCWPLAGPEQAHVVQAVWRTMWLGISKRCAVLTLRLDVLLCLTPDQASSLAACLQQVLLASILHMSASGLLLCVSVQVHTQKV